MANMTGDIHMPDTNGNLNLDAAYELSWVTQEPLDIELKFTSNSDDSYNIVED